MIVAPVVLGAIYDGVARAHGASSEEATMFRDRLLRADLRNHSTQGAALIPYIDEMLGTGQMRFRAPLEVLADAPAVALVDAHFGVGQVVGTRCMTIAIEKARTTGMGCVAVRNSGDFAMASAYSMLALDHGMVGFAMSNGKPLVAPWGGRDPLFCTNPISAAFPARDRFPIVIDMATSAFSMGEAIRTARDGRKLSSIGVVDSKGRYGDDPAAIVADPYDRESRLHGALLPLGPKGYSMLLMVELMCSALVGATGSWGNDYDPTGETPWRHGHCFLALAPDALAGLDAFGDLVDGLIDAVENSTPARGSAGVRVPGSAAHEEEVRRARDGVPVRDEELERLLSVARLRGLNELADRAAAGASSLP